LLEESSEEGTEDTDPAIDGEQEDTDPPAEEEEEDPPVTEPEEETPVDCSLTPEHEDC
jgi:hypothetical protein